MASSGRLFRVIIVSSIATLLSCAAVLALSRIKAHEEGQRELDAMTVKITTSAGSLAADKDCLHTPNIDPQIQNRAWGLIDPEPEYPRAGSCDYLQKLTDRAQSLRDCNPSGEVTDLDRTGLEEALPYFKPWEELLRTGHLVLTLGGWQNCPGTSTLPSGIQYRGAVVNEIRAAADYWSISAAAGDDAALSHLDSLCAAFQPPCCLVDALSAAAVYRARDNLYLAEAIRGQLLRSQLERWRHKSMSSLISIFSSGARTERILRGETPSKWYSSCAPLSHEWENGPRAIAGVIQALLDFEQDPVDFVPSNDFVQIEDWKQQNLMPSSFNDIDNLMPLWIYTLRDCKQQLNETIVQHEMECLAVRFVEQWRSGEPIPNVSIPFGSQYSSRPYGILYRSLSETRFILEVKDLSIPSRTDFRQAAPVIASKNQVEIWPFIMAVECAGVPRVPLRE